jgi:hypothetical protein
MDAAREACSMLPAHLAPILQFTTSTPTTSLEASKRTQFSCEYGKVRGILHIFVILNYQFSEFLTR